MKERVEQFGKDAVLLGQSHHVRQKNETLRKGLEFVQIWGFPKTYTPHTKLGRFLTKLNFQNIH
jgi:hypothetical protein